MQTSLRGISQKAKQEKDYRFGNLYGLLDKNALYTAWKDINKKASAGVDKVTAKEFAKNLDQNLEELLEELKAKKYKAKLVRRVDIPKGKGKTRPLGIPTVKWLFGTPREMALKINKKVLEETGIRSRIGIGENPYPWIIRNRKKLRSCCLELTEEVCRRARR